MPEKKAEKSIVISRPMIILDIDAIFIECDDGISPVLDGGWARGLWLYPQAR
jgi:hypothetical protein